MGIFYIPTRPLTKKKFLDVHRIHLLCGKFNGEILLDKLLSIIDNKMIPDNKIQEFRDMTYTTKIAMVFLNSREF